MLCIFRDCCDGDKLPAQGRLPCSKAQLKGGLLDLSYKIYHPAADHSGNHPAASGYVLGAGSYVPVGSHSFGQMLAWEVAGHEL